jgi:hypothetical protein
MMDRVISAARLSVAVKTSSNVVQLVASRSAALVTSACASDDGAATPRVASAGPHGGDCSRTGFSEPTQRTIMTRRARPFALLIFAIALAGCGTSKHDRSASTSANTVGGSSSPAVTTELSTSQSKTTDEPSTVGRPSTAGGCGVGLADVEAALASDVGVLERSTPDPYRCNFIWDDNGMWGIDAATVIGGRAQLSQELPAGDPVSGLGDSAIAFTQGWSRNLVVFVGDDVVAVDIVKGDSDGFGDVDADAVLRSLAQVALDRL